MQAILVLLVIVFVIFIIICLNNRDSNKKKKEQDEIFEIIKANAERNKAIEKGIDRMQRSLEEVNKVDLDSKERTIKENKNKVQSSNTRIATDLNYNIKNTHIKDLELKYNAENHIYTYKGKSLIPTSNLIEAFFPSFNSNYWAERKAIERYLDDPQQILDEWDYIGTLSKELGKFLHIQIENYFQKKKIEESYSFSYRSEYVNVDKLFYISKEFWYFSNFIRNKDILPYRTEWHIFDPQYMIAGTIDLLCKNKDNTYTLYDWKRSKKVGLEYNGSLQLSLKNYNYGYGELNHISDNTYHRYCLQQNIYKYILEKNYGMKISQMFLVILHPDYSTYHLVKVPLLFKEVSYMLNSKSKFINKLNY